MTFPSFFSEVQPIVMHDRLAEFLGAADAGIIEYRYVDAVKLAGHSCPTVAGAYLLTRRALAALYADELPERGEIEVNFREAQDAGVAGVMGAVVGLITGAAGLGGFKGIGGHFSRRNLLGFEALDLPGGIGFTRRDNGRTLTASLHLERVAPDPRTGPLLQRLLAGERDPAVAEAFAGLWQDRVRRILVDHGDDPELIGIA
ncbi:hypothetical protein [Propionivibrio sp.]|uniref:hypothetical protein n=2 Tax=Propionivibrio sp. TaxID=2212460 RepID=UPI0025E6F2A6|nr:hypothetical protein [Propionivibrio sp.]MBK7357286.1 hypothetical protein [Propionivibrio sp.]MBK8746013.1 hypothetical protein [Propionivibrio sp.]MBK8892543.1 hypothetical protein [Propionivibrio sp.]MBL0208670.1 hypothetical protein [Propionivibrio sp.]